MISKNGSSGSELRRYFWMLGVIWTGVAVLALLTGQLLGSLVWATFALALFAEGVGLRQSSPVMKWLANALIAVYLMLTGAFAYSVFVH
jgi:hypothetical protein